MSHVGDQEAAAYMGRRKKRKGRSGSQGKKEFKEGVINCINTNVLSIFMFPNVYSTLVLRLCVFLIYKYQAYMCI